MTLLATIVLLGVLIFVHELGHFWAAKAVGVGVHRFSIGLGPRLWGYTKGETEYVLSAIPLGGYVKMQGMEDEVMEHLEGRASEASRNSRPGDFDAKPIWARAFVISAGVVMNMLFAALVFTGVAAVWGVQEPTTTRVMAVEERTLPQGTEALADLAPGARVVRVGSVEPESWQQLRGAFFEAPAGPLAVVTEAPAGVFEVVMPPDEGSRGALVGSLSGWVDPVVGAVQEGTAAAAAGIEQGDRVTSVAGVPVGSWTDLIGEVRSRPGERLEVGVLRGGADLTFPVELDQIEVGDTGERYGRLGIYPATVRVGLREAVAIGVAETMRITRVILRFLRDLFTLDVSPRSVGSIGTIAVATGQAAEQGFPSYLRFMALFSINLAILNMLPIPILDGGHMVFLGVEMVRGQRLSVKQRIRWSQVGLVVVIGLMVWALGNDLLRVLGL